MSTGSNTVVRSELYAIDRSALRRRVAIVGIVAVVLSLVTLCVNDGWHYFENPVEVVSCYLLFFQQIFAGLDALGSAQILAMHPQYYQILHQAGTVFVTFIAGGMLALSGALFQNVFRNPIASPTMLGVSSGIRLGLLVFVIVFQYSAVSMLAMQYLFSYVAVAAVLVIVFGFTKVMDGPGRPFNVINMLLVGTIVNSLLGVLVTYLTFYGFEPELWEIYLSLSEVLVVDTNWYALVTIVVSAAITLVPVVLLRFRMNALGFDPSDMRMLGVNSRWLQIVALVCGAIMMTAAQVQVGPAAMITLVVPHISRSLFGAEFRKQFVGNMLLGAALLMACRCIVSFIPFVGSGLPIGTVADFVVLPAFIWILATQQRGWE